MSRARRDEPLIGEWACLGIVCAAPTHGFAIAARLKPSGDVGRVWSLSRPLTYRALEQLMLRGYVRAVGEERGIAGGNRTILAATRTGRTHLRTWLTTPVAHLRDVRSELLLKLVLAELCDVDVTQMLDHQRAHFEQLAAALAAETSDGTSTGTNAGTSAGHSDDVVALWRHESSEAALRFVARVRSTRP